MWRALTFAGLSVALVPALLLAACAWRQRPLPGPALGQPRWRRSALALAAAGLLGQLGGHGARLAAAAGQGGLDHLLLATLQTWIGRCLLLQLLLVMVAMTLCGRARAASDSTAPGPGPGRRTAEALVTAAALLGCAATGHAVAAQVAPTLSLAALLHVLLAGLWVGALPWLWAGLRHLPAAQGRALLGRFSALALAAMLLLLASGVLLACWSVASGAALLATGYGQRLLLKLVLVCAALGCAAWLRAWLARPMDTAQRRAGRWLGTECLLAGSVAVAAGSLAGLVPAAHEPIHWPWAWRLAPTTAWLQRGAAGLQAPLVGAAVLAGGGLLASAWLWRRRRHWAWAALTAGGVAGATVAAPVLTVKAYPTTYASSELPFDAASVQQGAVLYARHCVACHGVRGQGDGPLAARLLPRPANLTEPHLGWHTAGDMFWWLSHGMPGSAMPGFADRTTPLERWQLINHLTALSLGHQARNLGPRPVARDPWLVAPDFRHLRADGEYAQLSDWRRQQAVLLLLVQDVQGLALARQRVLEAPGLQARLIVVLPPALHMRLVAMLPAGTDAAAAVDLVSDDDGAIAAAWLHYRRTLANPDLRDDQPGPATLQFLVDRFGFVRARWRSDEPVGGDDIPALNAAIAQLAQEPELRSADAHAH